jgi:heat shock protein HslJ
MDQESWYTGFLAANPSYRLDRDTLILTAKGTTITFTDRKVAHPDRPLEGTTWHLDGFVDGDMASSLPAGLAATVRITGKQLTFEGCNTATATVRHDDRTVDVGPFTFPHPKPCPSGPAEVGSKVTKVLQGEVAYAIDGDTLTLSRGGHGLTLVARG